MHHISFAAVSKFYVVHAGACYSEQTSLAGRMVAVGKGRCGTLTHLGLPFPMKLQRASPWCPADDACGQTKVPFTQHCLDQSGCLLLLGVGSDL